jgi:medium-chain acyl-[acyl-carrier-protein] hydrolase
MNSRERSDETFLVVSYETDLFGKLSLYAMFNRFQELAGIHAEYLQVGYDTLRDAKLAWILSRIKIQIHSMPKWGNKVHLATWPKGIDRLFAIRDFCMTNENGEILIAATSAWLLIDINNGRPRRIETLPIDLRFPHAVPALQDPLDKIQMPDGLIPVLDKQIWLSDIDVNHHVNNAQYAEWITDCFSQDQYSNHQMKSVQINYLEETLQGDTITLLKTPNSDSANEYFLTGISQKKGSNVFHARVEWK